MQKKKIIKIIILLITLIIFTSSIIHKQMQNDIFFSIKTGQYILKHGINNVEPFTIHNNLKFTKLRWGFDIISYLIYLIGDFKGIYFFVILFSCIISSTLFCLLLKNKTSPIISFITTLLIISNYSYFFTARAQIISYLIFLLEIYCLYKLSETNKNNYSIILVILSFLLLTFHSSVWLVYLVFFMPFIVEMIIKKEYFNKKIIVTFIITILTGFLTPLGLTPFTYMPKIINSYSKVIIRELQPLTLKEDIIYFVALFIPILISLIRKIKIRLTDLFFILGCFIMAILATRNLYISLIAIAIPLTNIINNLKFEKYINKLDNIIIYSILIISICIYSFNNYKKIVNEKYIPENIYPVNAINYIKKNEDISKIRLFNDFNYGSYIEFNDIKAFIDSRSEIYCEEFNNTLILKEWSSFNNGKKEKINSIVKKYNITHLLVRRKAYYRNYLYYNDNFEILYEDEFYYLYKVKKSK